MSTMPTPISQFGIRAHAIELGRATPVHRLVTQGESAALIERTGFRRFHEIPDDVSTSALAGRAARRCLDKAGLSATDVDFIVTISAGVPEYLGWDVSAAVAAELGCERTRTLLLTQGCAAAVLGLEVVEGMFAVQPDIQRALYIAVDRLSSRHMGRVGTTTVDSDGSVALLLERGHERLRRLATAQITLPQYHDLFRHPYCGREHHCGGDPFANRAHRPEDYLLERFSEAPDALLVWAEQCGAAMAEVIEECCTTAGRSTSQLKWLLMLHDRRESMTRVARAADVSPGCTNSSLAPILGHFGGLDPLLDMTLLDAKGDLTAGDLLCLAGVSSGMHAFATLIEV